MLSKSLPNFGNFGSCSPSRLPWPRYPPRLSQPPAQQLLRANTRPEEFYSLVPERVEGNVTVSDSTNWSGYAVHRLFFHQFQSLVDRPHSELPCTTPKHLCRPSGSASTDGASSTVEQTGTDSDCSGSSPSYYAWYEFYPHPSYLISGVPVSPGNHMSASVLTAARSSPSPSPTKARASSYRQEFESQRGETVVGRMDCRSPLLHQRRRHFASLRFRHRRFWRRL